MNKPTINDFFAYSNDDGTIMAYKHNKLDTKNNKLYVLNNYGKKIVQLIINEESNTSGEKFAQIKIIPYGIKKVFDTSSLTQNFKRFENAELTYHGSNDSTKSSKIHLKYLEDKKYHTIVDNACEIKEKENQLIPLFSISAGNLYKNKNLDSIKKKNLIYKLNTNNSAVTLDFYIAGKDFNYEKYMNSIYSFSMFYSMDYLNANKGFPLYQSLIMQPIESYDINGYKLFIRTTKSENIGNPLSSTWIFFPVNRVVQYADEDLWFSLCIKNKIIKIGNGINIDNKLQIAKENLDKKTLNLIAVAQLADWHGYDRLIKAISKLDKDFKIRLKIVGDGYILSYLKNLTIELNLEDKITFTGSLFDRDLDNAFDEMDIGVSSLGLYRKGLSEASDLKTREYLARGLCTIGVGKDPDLDENSKYRFVVSNSDSIDDIVNLLIELKNINLPNRQEVRDYAIENLTFEKKLLKILKNKILCNIR